MSSLITRKQYIKKLFALEKISDNYPKYLLTTDGFTQDRNGVKHLNVYNWLLNKDVNG